MKFKRRIQLHPDYISFKVEEKTILEIRDWYLWYFIPATNVNSTSKVKNIYYDSHNFNFLGSMKYIFDVWQFKTQISSPFMRFGEFIKMHASHVDYGRTDPDSFGFKLYWIMRSDMFRTEIMYNNKMWCDVLKCETEEYIMKGLKK